MVLSVNGWGGRRSAVQVVLGLDDQTPSGPDDTRAGQRNVLSNGELLSRAREVGDASKDETPL